MYGAFGIDLAQQSASRQWSERKRKSPRKARAGLERDRSRKIWIDLAQQSASRQWSERKRKSPRKARAGLERDRSRASCTKGINRRRRCRRRRHVDVGRRAYRRGSRFLGRCYLSIRARKSIGVRVDFRRFVHRCR